MVLLLLYALLITSITKCCGIHQIKSEVLSLTRNIFKKKCTYLEIRSSEKPPFFIIVKQMPCDFFFFFKKECGVTFICTLEQENQSLAPPELEFTHSNNQQEPCYRAEETVARPVTHPNICRYKSRGKGNKTAHATRKSSTCGTCHTTTTFQNYQKTQRTLQGLLTASGSKPEKLK